MIALTLLTQPDCVWCTEGKRILAALAHEFPLSLEEVDLGSDRGRALATEHRLLFAPGLLAEDRLIAHGRLSERALRRSLTSISAASSPSRASNSR